MVNPVSLQPRPDTPSRTTSMRRSDAASLGRPQCALILLALLVALGGCGRDVRVAPFTPSPTASVAAPGPGQAARGLVGAMTTVIPPTPTASPVPPATPQPLIGTVQPVVTPEPLVAEMTPRSPAAAADLIAAGGSRQFAGACAEAIPLYEQAIATDPGFSNVYALLALCLYDQGRVDAAITRWQEALQRDPLSPDALAGLGTGLYRQGQQEAGLARYRQAVALDPRYADETFLRTDSLWGGSAIFDSRELRLKLLP
jgi:hypothetical protein